LAKWEGWNRDSMFPPRERISYIGEDRIEKVGETQNIRGRGEKDLRLRNMRE
jgi:hypothetical protein